MKKYNSKTSLQDLIGIHEREGDFTHADVTDRMITDAESELQVHLPVNYIRFLKNLGQGGFSIFAILGFRDDGVPCFVDVTEYYRRYHGLPVDFVVIEELDDDIACCINTANGSVVEWKKGYGQPKHLSDSFADYFKDRILDSLGDPYYEVIRFLTRAESMMS